MAKVDNRFRARQRRWRIGLHAAALLSTALVACTSPAPKPSATTPAAAAKPAPKAAADVPVLAPATADKDQARIVATLSRSNRDSLRKDEVGYYMDVLQGRLKQVNGNELTIVRHADRIAIGLNGRFEQSKARLQPGEELRGVLNAIAKVLVEYDKTFVSVRPAAPTIDSDPGVARQGAIAVARYLERAGLMARHVAVVSGGGKYRGSAATGDAQIGIELEIVPVERAETGKR